MSKSIRFFDFHGVVPSLDETLLNAMSAMVAEDIDLSRGNLEPWRWAAEPVATRQNPIRTMIDPESSCDFITWDSVIDVDLGQPVCNDIGMMFWIEDGVVMQGIREEVCQGIYEPLGVDCPTTPPSGGSGAGGEGCAVVESFCYTYVNRFGQESAPSPYSSINIGSTGGANISIPASNPQRTVHIYRMVPDASSGREGALNADGAWVRVGEGLTGTVVQTRPVSQTAETLRSFRWAKPPTGVTSLTVCSSSNTLFLAKGNRVYVSHPGQYHAFTNSRDLILQDNVVGLSDYADTVVVLTDGHPYTLTPIQHRDRAFTYSVARLDTSMPCVSKASISTASVGVVWASNNGLFVISKGRYGIRINSLTSNLINLDDWRQLQPETIRGEMHDGTYYFTGDGEITCSITGHTASTWVLVFNDEIYNYPTNVQLTSLSIKPLMWHHSRTGEMYYSLGTELYRWNPVDGELRPYTYITRLTVLQGMTTLGAAKIHHDSTALVNISLWKEVCNKILRVFSRNLSHCEPFRLPGCLHTIHQYLRIVSTSRVRSIHLATSIRDLTNHDDATYTHGNKRLSQRQS